MSHTPPLRSAFPSTPTSAFKTTQQHGSSTRPVSSKARSEAEEPTISSRIADAPSQRFYVLIVYALINVWRCYDLYNLHDNKVEGFWLFTKWVGIDTAFLYGLSGLRIPWLQWSSATFTVLFIAHGILNWFLMFRIPIPLFSFLAGLTRVVYERELAISERSVNPGSILHNSSLILGKQIIHILPEGSAVLNPDDEAFCVGDLKPWTQLPIRINQTTPLSIDLHRVDIDTSDEEIISISSKDIKKMKRLADSEHASRGSTSPHTLLYPVRQTGLFRLQRVVDESKLEVRKRHSGAVVVRCPTSSVQTTSRDKCKGELSDFHIEVVATPPVKVRYSKMVNGENLGHTFLHVHPENLVDAAFKLDAESSLDVAKNKDLLWARPQLVKIPMNESLGVGGAWSYIIDEVSDALGNAANYSDLRNREPTFHRTSQKHLEQHFLVHDRPRVAFRGCDAQQPLKVPRGKYISLPIAASTGPHKDDGGPYALAYLFTPQEDILPGQKHARTAQFKQINIKDGDRGVEVREPGLYSLTSIASDVCHGEVLEPSSCLLSNPSEPDLNMVAEPIPDKCAGNSIGLMVNLDFIGTPPFHVHYTVRKRSGSVTSHDLHVDRFHTQLELKPSDTGHYTYEFSRISDDVYPEPRSLIHKSLLLEQDVKAPASVYVFDADIRRKVCIDESTTIIVHMLGEAPFDLDYEHVHRGKRATFNQKDIQENPYYLKTNPLTTGGEHVFAFTSIVDRSGCKVALNSEVNIDVSPQKPQASFGSIDGSRSVSAREGERISLPLRLQGEAPWTLYYRRLEDAQQTSVQKILRHSNDQMVVGVAGTYELIDLHDTGCPGTVDSSANHFTVGWISRPTVAIQQTPLINQVRDAFVKRDVCQGDEDTTDIQFAGVAPFTYEYEQRLNPIHGSQSVSEKKFSSGLHQIAMEMETSQPGLYEYKILKLGDMSYNHDQRKFKPLKIQQRVHPRPSASFAEPGKIYRYCQDEEAGGENVPVNLVGQPPFHLELEVKHHAISQPEFVSIPHVESTRYNLQVPHRLRALGTHSITIRKVRDIRGCQRQMDRNAPHIQISIAELPSISPLEGRRDYCVGDRISYSLSGTPPFSVFYTFEGRERKASVPSKDFRRIAEKPGDFVITAVSDHRSTDTCKARTELIKTIHEMPSVRVSKGRTSTVDIHEGGDAEIQFDFGGTPPFHFTYTRSSTSTRGKKSEILETKNEISYEYTKTVRASDEGVYEVVSIRDKFCSFSTQNFQGKVEQKRLTNW